MGLIAAFTAVANANPAEKADLLSASISVAMNTTAFGLIVAIPSYVLYAFLVSQAKGLLHDIERGGIEIINLIEDSRQEREIISITDGDKLKVAAESKEDRRDKKRRRS